MICSLAACESKRQELADPEIVERDGIEYLARSTEPLTADVLQWHEDGQLRRQFTVIDGKREGLDRWWHVNGQLKVERTYVTGEQDGLARLWHENGRLWAERTYVNGKQNGLYQAW